MIGASSRTEWLPPAVEHDSSGFIRTWADVSETASWPLDRAALSLETSMPGVFAVGDVHHNSMNRVASAVGEESSAVRLVHDLFAHERSRRLRVSERANAASGGSRRSREPGNRPRAEATRGIHHPWSAPLSARRQSINRRGRGRRGRRSVLPPG